MARGIDLSHIERQRIAEKIKALVPDIERNVGLVGGRSLDLRESLRILFLPISRVDASPADVQISSLLEDTHKIRHQLSSGGVVSMSAETRSISVGGNDDTEVCAVGSDEIALSIDSVIDKIDADFPGDVQVELLEAPGYQVSALLIHDGSQERILILTGPEGHQSDKYLTSSEFIGYLKAVGPSFGLTEEPR